MKKRNIKSKILRHLTEDIHESKESIAEDKKLKGTVAKVKKLKADVKRDKRDKKFIATKSPKAVAKHDKVKKVMHEFKEGKLRSGSKKGPEVTNPKQAIAIALSEARRKRKK